MKLKYSVFLGNVGHCFDRYCPKYAKPFTLEELFDRVASKFMRKILFGGNK